MTSNINIIQEVLANITESYNLTEHMKKKKTPVRSKRKSEVFTYREM